MEREIENLSEYEQSEQATQLKVVPVPPAVVAALLDLQRIQQQVLQAQLAIQPDILVSDPAATYNLRSLAVVSCALASASVSILSAVGIAAQEYRQQAADTR